MSLLKIKEIAASPDLPDELRRGVSKPAISEEEQAALHNVTSGLYNREPVKRATDQAIRAVSEALGLALSAQSKRRQRSKDKDKLDESVGQTEPCPDHLEHSKGDTGTDLDSAFEGFSDLDETSATRVNADDDEEGEQADFEELEDMLGDSSEDEGDWDDEKYDQYRGQETVNLDDISQSESSEGSDDESESETPSPPPGKAQKSSKKAAKTPTMGTPGSALGLPTLLGGYISGSESASDIEEAKPKKRRGQKARQAIWEKKYGSAAKHLQKQAESGGRDTGWDMRRGAVDRDDRGSKVPWKKGVRNPTAGNGMSRGHVRAVSAPKITRRDDQGPLHPSWEARKKAKESQKVVEFAGQKVVFD